MGPRRHSSPWAAIGALLALLVGPVALGLVARAGPRVVARFSAWWPPEGLDLLPLGVAALVVLVTAFALATRGRRARRTRSTGTRRFLPPLDLLLLQLGNVSFLAFALILAIVALGLLSSGLGVLARHPLFVANDFTFSLGVAAVVALIPLARRSPQSSGDRWRRRAVLLGLAAAGLWLLVALAGPGPPISGVAAGQLEPATLVGLHLLLWLVLAAAALAGRFKGRGLEREGTQADRRTGAVLSTWAGYLGFLTLYLDGALLTIRSLLAGG